MAYQLGPIYITGSSLVVTGSITVSGSLTAGARTQAQIDLSTPYTIPGGGVYEIVTATDQDISFPNPTNYQGQTITVINADGSPASTAATNQPVNSEGTPISSLTARRMYIFVSVNDKWYGGTLNV